MVQRLRFVARSSSTVSVSGRCNAVKWLQRTMKNGDCFRGEFANPIVTSHKGVDALDEFVHIERFRNVRIGAETPLRRPRIVRGEDHDRRIDR